MPFVWRLVSIDLDEAGLYQVIPKRGMDKLVPLLVCYRPLALDLARRVLGLNAGHALN